MTEAEMAGWHHWPNGGEFEWTLGVGDGQGGLACCNSWGHKESDMTQRLNWTIVLKLLESPLDGKEIQPVNPRVNQSWIFIERTVVEAETPILWPPSMKNWLIWKDPHAEINCIQEEKGTTEDEVVGWQHWLDEHEFEQCLGVGDSREAWPAVVPGVTKSQTLLSIWTEYILIGFYFYSLRIWFRYVCINIHFQLNLVY